MKDLFFKDLSYKDLSYKVLLNIVERKRRTHILFIPKSGLSDQRLPNNRNERKGYAYS